MTASKYRLESAGGTEEGNATTVVTDGTATLLVQWFEYLVLPIFWYLLLEPVGIKQGLQPLDKLNTTQLDHFTCDPIHSWGPSILELSNGSADLLL